MPTTRHVHTAAEFAHKLRPDQAPASIERFLINEYSHVELSELMWALAKWGQDPTAINIGALKSRAERYWPPPTNTGPPTPPTYTPDLGTPPDVRRTRPGVPPPPGTTAADIARQLAERRRTCEQPLPESGVVVS